MNPIRVAGPAVEPVTLAEMRLYLRLDDEAEDDLVARLIAAARFAIEAEAGCVLLAQTWRLALPLPSGRGAPTLPLRPGPVLAVTAVSVIAADGGTTLLDPGTYSLQRWVDPARLVLSPDAFPTAGTLTVDFESGFGTAAEDVPEPLRQAIRMLVARWFESRGDGATLALPPDVAGLVAPYRRRRLA